ncbi:MarR family winged helix-turn-helix transcriptional regulator [Phytomonospora endophytica]|uniref:DNA-binding MarR family transcriptional regulator n=1 Tax=Phytomonospora endophytica TaxID=714109 RepID=A0A841FJP9_9ACTN|nr:MarR family transcriptional regulator [Phytomonospora endophytica]MBB6037541.1 DNA-binding MarR family transcriptional regulator [Phytomonospora endophytica]GIG70242.1 MarR family transcriptional regulator [Phytomonospora endophytica]
MGRKETEVIGSLERAMIEIRRSQRRRALMKRELADAPTALGANFDVLDVIEAAGDEAVGVREVASALSVDQPRASKLVAGAVEAGYVRREADQADGRRTLLVLTEAGRDVVDRAHVARQGAMRRATAGWTAEERETFAGLLTRFVAGLE